MRQQLAKTAGGQAVEPEKDIRQSLLEVDAILFADSRETGEDGHSGCRPPGS